MSGIFSSKNYDIMQKDRLVASISSHGVAEIFDEKFMPYDLYLEEDAGNDIDSMINNNESFDLDLLEAMGFTPQRSLPDTSKGA